MNRDATSQQKKRLLHVVARTTHERACLLRPQSRSATARFLEMDFGQRFVGSVTGADA
jgi:hypothetical protein